MMKSELHPPRSGLNADPILYGVAAGLAELFPPVNPPGQSGGTREREASGDGEQESREDD